MEIKGSEKLYGIKPLAWVRADEEIAEHDDIEDKYEASTPFGGYDIEMICGSWCARYCFAEWYDDGELGGSFDSLKEAQDQATAHWEERLCKALVQK